MKVISKAKNISEIKPLDCGSNQQSSHQGNNVGDIIKKITK